MAVLAKRIHLPAQRVGKVVSAPPATDLPRELLVLSSLDAREGVRRIGGKVEAYRRQLRRFREHYADAAEKLQRLICEHSRQQAHEYCHQLKGVTGNIGASALYEKVAAIDAELKQEKIPDTVNLDEVHALLQNVMRDIDSLATTSPAPTSAAVPLAPEQLRERLEQLGQALEYDLGNAESLLAELRTGVSGTLLEPEIAAIAARIDVFDIDAAQTLLATLRSTSHDHPPGAQLE